MDSAPFLSPRLIGKRFEGGAIPLEMLRDLATLEDMVVEVAKWTYLNEHPDRQRTPRGFADSVHFRLTEIRAGSSIPVISIEPMEGTLPSVGHRYQPYLEKARDAIVDTIASANDDASASYKLPRRLLGYFDRLGRSLRDDESIEFSRPHASPVRLTRAVRRKLLEASSVRSHTEEVTLRGVLPAADQERLTFQMTLIDGRKVPGVIPEEHVDTFLEAFNLYREGTKILVSGIGRFDRDKKLERIDSVDRVSLLDELDVPARIDELRLLQHGWLEGHGIAPDSAHLDWFAEQFEHSFAAELPLPFVYPTEAGGLRLEWDFASHDLSVEVNLQTRKAELHCLDLEANRDAAETIDLSTEDGWNSLGDVVARRCKGNEP